MRCIAVVAENFKQHVSHSLRPILFRQCRSKKDDSNSSGGDKIGATLMACEAHGRICRNFDQHKMASMP